MIGALVAVASCLCAANPEPAPARFCAAPADCGAQGVCLGGLCRQGADRATVTTLYRVAITPPLVVSQAPWLRTLAAELAAQIRADLQWSGLYDVVPPEQLPTHWRAEGVSPSETQRLAWQLAGVWRVIKIGVRPGRDPHTAIASVRVVEAESFGVLDVPGGQVTILPGAVRRAAADFVNALIAADTGLPGVVGTQLAASVEVKPGVKEIGVLDLDGGGLTFITANGNLNLDPAWAPGGRVGYMSYRRSNADWMVEGRPLSSRPGMNAVGAWSPDGRYLALSISAGDHTDIVILTAATGEEYARLTAHPSVNTSPTWAPDGKRLAFVSDRAGTPQVWIVRLDSGELSRLTGGYTGSPDWSPLGESLAYAQMAGSTFVIMRHDFDHGRTVRLTPPTVSSESPFFSPDGRYIVFVRREGQGPRRLWLMDADGSRARPLTLRYPQQMFSPSWRR